MVLALLARQLHLRCQHNGLISKNPKAKGRQGAAVQGRTAGRRSQRAADPSQVGKHSSFTLDITYSAL